MKPNLFKIATKELSQDAFFTWLIQWANPDCKEYDQELHQLGREFLGLVISDSLNIHERPLIKIDAGRQWENIDVWAELYFEDNNNIFLILEDKVFSNEHSNQLNRYKEIAEKFCKENNFSLSCAFLKTGSEPLKELSKIEEKGFKIINRKDLLKLFQNVKCNHTTITDYLDYLQTLDDAHEAYVSVPIENWSDLAWIGFYQFIEREMPINTWHYVANPSGGFWNLCLTWKYWDCFPVYSQIEQGKLTFKIGLGKDETGNEEGEVDNNAVQDFVHSQLIQFAKEKGLEIIERPYPFVHRGNYRTIGVVKLSNWIGNVQQQVDLKGVIQNLKRLNEFHTSFIDHLSEIQFSEVL